MAYLQPTESFVCECSLVSVRVYASSSRNWLLVEDADEDVPQVLMTRDMLTGYCRCIVYLSPASTPIEHLAISRIVSDHLVHPKTKFMESREEETVTRTFWVQDYVANEDTCLMLEFEDQDSSEKFVEQYQRLQEEMAR